jgi:putative oxidoreductase
MEYLFLIGRILYALVFLMSGINHLRNSGAMAGYAASKGVPAPRLAILGTGVLMLLGGLSIALGVQPTWGIVLITVFLIPTTVMMHNFWADTDPMARLNNLINFQKNVALVGAAWVMLMVPQPWVLSLGQ